mgnify:CR=1 FL=1
MNRLLFIIFLLTGISGHAKDLDMFSLKGSVDSLCIIIDDAGLTWQTEFKFDNNGYLIEFDGIKIDTERNELNQITDFIIEEDDEDSEPITIETILEYDSHGRVIKTTNISPDEEWTETFTYDDKGRLLSKVYESPYASEKFSYVYVKEDSKGNWTQRQEKIASTDQITTHTRNIIYKPE